jgi:hypothetical protein
MDRAMQCYLKARELHLMFTPAANARARELFQEAIDEANQLGYAFHRAKGHLAYSNLHAWLYGWADIDLTANVLSPAWSALYDKAYPDASASHAGADDYDNWWSVGVALLYYAAHGDLDEEDRSDAFNASIGHYGQARTTAWPDENDQATMVAIREDVADLLADYAEALYFRGDGNDVQGALDLLTKAKNLSAPNHPKWHDWNRAWALYELGGELGAGTAQSHLAYMSAISLLTGLPTLPNQYRRTLAACYAALGWNEEARREGREFLRHERARGRPYNPAIEMRWPYKNPQRGKDLRERLRKAGIPAPE